MKYMSSSSFVLFCKIEYILEHWKWYIDVADGDNDRVEILDYS